jgi:type IV pilus assembly protein PilE
MIARTASRRGMLGVTLLELMAVVMVIGILGMIAIPSYRQYSIRAQRTDAKAALLQLATNQERFYLINRRYGNVTELQNSVPPLLSANARSERGAYQITIPVWNANTFTATATPVTGGAFDQTADGDCATFSITAQGVRTHTGNVNATCW